MKCGKEKARVYLSGLGLYKQINYKLFIRAFINAILDFFSLKC